MDVTMSHGSNLLGEADSVSHKRYLEVSRVRHPGGHTWTSCQLQLVKMIYHELSSSGSSVLDSLPGPGGWRRRGGGGGGLSEGEAGLSCALPTCHVGQHWAD